MSSEIRSTAKPGTSPATPRAPYVPPSLESLGSWGALTMVLTGGGFIDLSRVRNAATDYLR